MDKCREDRRNLQEVVPILEHVQQAITEHRNMQENVELYLEQNGVKQEYEQYMEKRLSEPKIRKIKTEKSTREATKKLSERNLKGSKAR